jgi:hypothetical protein
MLNVAVSSALTWARGDQDLWGGACLLRRRLSARFGGKVVLPDDPVLATARGLYKMALLA